MIVTAIADPAAFDQRFCNDKAYRYQAEQFLNGIASNGLLISDEDEVLIREMGARIKALPTPSGQRLQIFFTEIKKAEDRRIVNYRASITSRAAREICCELECHESPDAVVSSPDHLAHFQAHCTKAKVIPLADYSNSEFEDRRRQFGYVPPLHKLPFSDCEDLFIRVLRFAKYVRIYDKQIGKGRNMRDFLRGIRFILRLWRDHGYFASQSDGLVEIYTCEKRPQFSAILQDNENAVADISRDLMSMLRGEFAWPIRLIVKHDPDNAFHARYLQTQSTILLMERGFDFINRKGRTVKQAEVALRPKAIEQLQDYRNLQDSFSQEML